MYRCHSKSLGSTVCHCSELTSTSEDTAPEVAASQKVTDELMAQMEQLAEKARAADKDTEALVAEETFLTLDDSIKEARRVPCQRRV